MKKGFWIVLVILVVVLSFLAWQSLRSPSSPSSGSDVKVVSSTYPLAFVASQILGTEVANVETVVPLGAEPHEFEPTPSQVARLFDASIFMYNGVDLDPWADRIGQDLADKGVVPMRASAGLDLIDGDPHFWLDPQNMILVGERLSAVLSKLDPERSSEYKNNFESFRGKLQSLDDNYKTGLATCMKKDLVISHNFFAYPAKKYGLQVWPISGLSPEAESTTKNLTGIIDVMQQQQLGYIFSEELVTSKAVEVLQQETGAQLLRLNPLEGLSEEQAALGEDYVSLMNQNLESLKIGLSCN